MAEDAFGVKRRDTTKGPPLRVLCLDGGGVRGYSTMIIIQELMHRTFVEIEGRAPRRHEIPKPCDHFDLIVGTGTGGLIALMLGRLRLDLETCKELYVQMTRRVFQTDKTIAGIPYRSTLFKASKLEEAIKEAVRENTGDDKDGRGHESQATLVNPLSRENYSGGHPRRNLSNASTVSFSARSPTAQMARPMYSRGRGDPNARLYDPRENRTKTAVTAMYKGSPKGAPAALLRSYDSRHEPPPEFDCTIWQAGRATSAVGLAFKPIQIGQSVFHDDGAGTFNPAPEALDEAMVNEWPGRDMGVFVSVGTGKRPKSSDNNSHMWYEGFLGEFAEARKRLIAKIENCEAIHEFIQREYLAQRGVLADDYYRLNVEIGVGEFGMNEWHRLGDISTSTRRYMARHDEQKMVRGISTKLAKIHRARQRVERQAQGVPEIIKSTSTTTMENPFAVELPGDIPTSPRHSQQYHSDRASFESGLETLHISPHPHGQQPQQGSPRSSRSGDGHLHPPLASPNGSTGGNVSDNDPDRLLGAAPTPSQYRTASGNDKIAITSPDEQPRPLTASSQQHQQQQHHVGPTRIEPPPLPPKTPLPEGQANRMRPGGGDVGGRVATPPYPLDDEEPPPPVNMARKPDMRGR